MKNENKNDCHFKIKIVCSTEELDSSKYFIDLENKAVGQIIKFIAEDPCYY